MLSSDMFQPILEGMTPLQKQICRRLAAGDNLFSVEARKSYSEVLARSSISPGSISDALKALVDSQVLCKPAGSPGGYTFDDPMFREWMTRLVSLSLPTSITLTTLPPSSR